MHDVEVPQREQDEQNTPVETNSFDHDEVNVFEESLKRNLTNISAIKDDIEKEIEAQMKRDWVDLLARRRQLLQGLEWQIRE